MPQYGNLKIDSFLYNDSGSDITLNCIDIARRANPVFTGNPTINAQGQLRLADSDSSHYVGFKSPASVTTSLVWTLPAADATSSGQVLTSNASGVLSWATVGGSSISDDDTSVVALESGGTQSVKTTLNGTETLRITAGTGGNYLAIPASIPLHLGSIAASTSAGVRLIGTGTDSNIALFGSGSLKIQASSGSGDADMAVFAKGGAVTLSFNGAAKIATTNTGVTVTGGADFSNESNINIGTALSIRHFSTSTPSGNGWISGDQAAIWSNTAKPIRLYNYDSTTNPVTWHPYITCESSTKAVALYYNGSSKLTTTNLGITVTGTTTTTGVDLGDNNSIQWGEHDDLNISHNSNTGKNRIICYNNRTLDIESYDGTSFSNMITVDPGGGVDFYHNGTKKVEVVSTGLTVTGTVAAGAASFTDDGSAGPVINISGDDANLWYGRIGNETYHNDTNTGFKFYVADSGDAVFQHRGNSEYRNWYISSMDGTNNVYDIYRTVAGAVYLYHNGNPKMSTQPTGIVVTGTVTDDKGDVRNVPKNYKNAAYTLLASDAGKCITVGGAYTVTIPYNVMSDGDVVTIVNNHSAAITIARATNVILTNAADGTDSNKTLAAKGMVSMWFMNAGHAYISGAGLS